MQRARKKAVPDTEIRPGTKNGPSVGTITVTITTITIPPGTAIPEKKMQATNQGIRDGEGHMAATKMTASHGTGIVIATAEESRARTS